MNQTVATVLLVAAMTMIPYVMNDSTTVDPDCPDDDCELYGSSSSED